MTEREGAIITAYTGIMCCSFSAFHAYAEEIMEHPILSHQFANQTIMTAIKELATNDFMYIVNNQTKDVSK